MFGKNRIVVQYDFEGLVLLGSINNETGEELDIHKLSLDESFLLCKTYDGFDDFTQIKKLIKDNEEGFVIKFSNNDRVKIKSEEYCRLHKILTGVSNVVIWEHLSEGRNFDELLDRIPDEMYDYIKATIKELEDKYREIILECAGVYKELETRKDTALYFQTQKYPAVLFSMLNKRSVSPIIWKLIKPKYKKPFSNKEE